MYGEQFHLKFHAEHMTSLTIILIR